MHDVMTACFLETLRLSMMMSFSVFLPIDISDPVKGQVLSGLFLSFTTIIGG